MRSDARAAANGAGRWLAWADRLCGFMF